MKEYPILFNAEMVRAVLDGRKTVTRRVVKPQPDMTTWKPEARTTPKEWRPAHRLGPGHHFDDEAADWNLHNKSDSWRDVPYTQRRCPYGSPGDRLWVRETWCEAVDPLTSLGYEPRRAYHRATHEGDIYLDDGDGAAKINQDGTEASPWKPSIHMPRWASRILLEVVSVRVERVQEISEKDAWAEGWPGRCDGTLVPGKDVCRCHAQSWFKRLWDSINAKRGYGWDKSPWVWVVEFKRVEG